MSAAVARKKDKKRRKLDDWSRRMLIKNEPWPNNNKKRRKLVDWPMKMPGVNNSWPNRNGKKRRPG